MVKVDYMTAFEADTGEVEFVTPCPWVEGVRVGSDDCVRCADFRAVLFTQQVECGKNQ